LAPLVAQYLVRRFSRLRFRNDAQRRMAVAGLLAWMAWRKRLPRAMGGSTSRGSQGIPIAFEAREAELVRRIRMQTLAVSQWPQKAQAVLPRRIIALNIISRNAARSMRPEKRLFSADSLNSLPTTGTFRAINLDSIDASDSGGGWRNGSLWATMRLK